MPAIDDALQRWIRAGVLDQATAERIRVFEASRGQPAQQPIQVLPIPPGKLNPECFASTHAIAIKPDTMARQVYILITYLCGHCTSWQWRVRTEARDGKLVVVDARNVLPRSETLTIWLSSDQACDRVQLSPGVDFFVPDTAKSPFPLKTGAELWAEVTVPPEGPPRPIQLAISDNGQWKPLRFN